ncbi:unnamed protein product, partial [Chrysoparadoxa australica]
MGVQFAPNPAPPSGPGPSSSSGGGRKLKTAQEQAKNVRDILKTVTPNYVLTAVIKNRLQEGEIRAQKKRRKTRQEVLGAMDLRELQMERLAMARMGFLDKAKEVEQWIDRERQRAQRGREEQEKSILNQKLSSLEMGQRRRMTGLESKLMQEMTHFLQKCEKEKQDTRNKDKAEYNMLIEETAQRAYGGVSSCQCKSRYLCRHNKTASYNTRKPTRDVIRLRQNAERLRATGRIEEAEEFERQAQDLDDAADKRWRMRVEQSIVSSAWSGGKSRLEQLVEKQQHTMKSLEETHEAKKELLKKQQEIQRRNLRSTFEAERKKVVMYCRRAALKRMTRDIKEDAENEDRIMSQKSDGLNNVSANMLGESDDDDSSEDSDESKEKIDWVAPTASGVDNSEAISNYDDLKSGRIYEELEEMKKRGVRVETAVKDYTKVQNELDEQTSGSRFNDAFRIARAQVSMHVKPSAGGIAGPLAGGVLGGAPAPAPGQAPGGAAPTGAGGGWGLNAPNLLAAPAAAPAPAPAQTGAGGGWGLNAPNLLAKPA